MYNTLDDTIGFATAQTGRNLNHLMYVHLTHFNITPEQWVVMKRLDEYKQLTQKELARVSQKNKTTLTKILDLLIGKGLVQKRMSDRDRRSFLIELTEEGSRLHEEITPLIEEIYTRVVKEIPAEQLAVFKEVLELINKGIDKEFQKIK